MYGWPDPADRQSNIKEVMPSRALKSTAGTVQCIFASHTCNLKSHTFAVIPEGAWYLAEFLCQVLLTGAAAYSCKSSSSFVYISIYLANVSQSRLMKVAEPCCLDACLHRISLFCHRQCLLANYYCSSLLLLLPPLLLFFSPFLEKQNIVDQNRIYYVSFWGVC